MWNKVKESIKDYWSVIKWAIGIRFVWDSVLAIFNYDIGTKINIAIDQVVKGGIDKIAAVNNYK